MDLKLEFGMWKDARDQMPAEVQGWLEDFRIVVETKGPTAILNHLVQMGVEDPSHCECDEIDRASQDRGWCHRHHTAYNRAVHNIISAKPGLIAKLRRVLREDLRAPDQFFEDDVASFGRIVKKSYGRALLDNFLTRDPTWCLKQREEAPVA